MKQLNNTEYEFFICEKLETNKPIFKHEVKFIFNFYAVEYLFFGLSKSNKNNLCKYLTPKQLKKFNKGQKKYIESKLNKMFNPEYKGLTNKQIDNLLV